MGPYFNNQELHLCDKFHIKACAAVDDVIVGVALNVLCTGCRWWE